MDSIEVEWTKAESNHRQFRRFRPFSAYLDEANRLEDSERIADWHQKDKVRPGTQSARTIRYWFDMQCAHTESVMESALYRVFNDLADKVAEQIRVNAESIAKK